MGKKTAHKIPIVLCKVGVNRNAQACRGLNNTTGTSLNGRYSANSCANCISESGTRCSSFSSVEKVVGGTLLVRKGRCTA